MRPSIAVIVNASGGRASREGDALKDKLIAAFAAHGVAVDPRLVEASDLAEAIAGARGNDVVAVGGGDGTQGSAAQLVMNSGQTLAVLPLGTLNHLAHDLGIPDDLEAAAGVAVNGTEKVIDLGEAGEQVFVNNASVGLYTRLVRNRDARPLPKWLATVPAAWTVLKGFRTRRLEIEIDGTRRFIETPLLFIGNNPYNLKGERMGRRDALDTGTLGLNAVRHKNAAALLGFALRALIGRADPARDFVDIEDSDEFVLHGSGSIDVAHDGEVTRMQLPLHFRALPGALRVKVPA